jgi:hypothetical protein
MEGTGQRSMKAAVYRRSGTTGLYWETGPDSHERLIQ